MVILSILYFFDYFFIWGKKFPFLQGNFPFVPVVEPGAACCLLFRTRQLIEQILIAKQREL